MLNILKIIIKLFPISDEFIWWCILTEFFDVFSLLSSVLTANTHCFVLERRKQDEQGMPMVPSQQIQPIRKRLLHNQPIGKHLWFRCSRYSLHVYTTTALICACNVKANVITFFVKTVEISIWIISQVWSILMIIAAIFMQNSNGVECLKKSMNLFWWNQRRYKANWRWMKHFVFEEISSVGLSGSIFVSILRITNQFKSIVGVRNLLEKVLRCDRDCFKMVLENCWSPKLLHNEYVFI